MDDSDIMQSLFSRLKGIDRQKAEEEQKRRGKINTGKYNMKMLKHIAKVSNSHLGYGKIGLLYSPKCLQSLLLPSQLEDEFQEGLANLWFVEDADDLPDTLLELDFNNDLLAASDSRTGRRDRLVSKPSFRKCRKVYR